MAQRIRRLPCFLAIVGFAACSFAQNDRRPTGEIRADLDSYLQKFQRANDFSGVVLVAEGGQILFQKAYGTIAPGSKQPIRVNTAFRIASLSKTFTAGAIEILIEQGRVKLDDSLSKFVPDFPNGDKITIKQLLVHQSGVGEVLAADLQQHCVSTGELVKRIAQVPPQFAPGAGDNYSNEGYVLLAAVIEKASGKSYEQFLAENIFAPLGMKHSGVMCTKWPVNNHASGSIAGLDDSVMPLPFEEAGWNGAGSIYSTAGDLHLWLKALASDRLSHFSTLPYPFGWGKRNYSKHPLVEQTGQLEGYTSHMAFYPQEKIFLVMLNRIESGFFNRTPRDFDSIVFGGKTSEPPPVQVASVDAAALAALAGDYLLPDFPIPLRFVQKDGRLYLHWGDDPFLRPLVPTGDGLFERAEYGSFHFERGKDGRVTGLTARFGDGDPMHLSKKPN